MLLVRATEKSKRQTESAAEMQWACGVWTACSPRDVSQSLLERSTEEGDSPVGRTEQDVGGIQSSVPRKWGMNAGGINSQP
jgi:hypothetical protein